MDNHQSLVYTQVAVVILLLVVLLTEVMSLLAVVIFLLVAIITEVMILLLMTPTTQSVSIWIFANFQVLQRA